MRKHIIIILNPVSSYLTTKSQHINWGQKPAFHLTRLLLVLKYQRYFRLCLLITLESCEETMTVIDSWMEGNDNGVCVRGIVGETLLCFQSYNPWKDTHLGGFCLIAGPQRLFRSLNKQSRSRPVEWLSFASLLWPSNVVLNSHSLHGDMQLTGITVFVVFKNWAERFIEFWCNQLVMNNVGCQKVRQTSVRTVKSKWQILYDT